MNVAQRYRFPFMMVVYLCVGLSVMWVSGMDVDGLYSSFTWAGSPIWFARFCKYLASKLFSLPDFRELCILEIPSSSLRIYCHWFRSASSIVCWVLVVTFDRPKSRALPCEGGSIY